MSEKIIPSQRQLEFMDWEFGVFFHFGIRSFFKGHKDWDNRPMPADQFNPDELNCEEWIRTIKQAGATYAILTCKHHDGFANWPTRYSDYSVAHTPWRHGQGDVVREYVNACRKYGLKVGLYYSPAQWGGQTVFKEGKEYDDYFINQITELLTGYGKIDYLWFDGCGSQDHEYDRDRIIAAIRGMQPEIRIFAMWDPDSRWVGNEDGYAPLCNFNEVNYTAEKSDGTRKFLPSECDFKMRSTWFDCEDNEDTIKEMEELVGIYEMSVGRGANFLINIGPNRRGLLPEKDTARLLEFGEEIRRRYGEAVEGFGAPRQVGEDEFAIELPGFTTESSENDPVKPQLVNRVVLSEDMTNGQGVTGFELWANLPAYKGKQVCLYKGDTIGHKAICLFPTMRTARITLRVTGHEGGYALSGMKAYFVR